MKILSSRRSLEPSNWVRTFERLFGLGRREFEEANPQKFKCSSGAGGGGGARRVVDVEVSNGSAHCV